MAVRELRGRSSAEPEHLDLVRAMGRRDGGAARELYDLYGDRVFRFILRSVGEQVQDAEDLTLETFTSAVSLAATFDGRSSVFVWLCGIARVRIIDFHRQHSRAKRSPQAGVTSLSELDDEDLHQSGDGRAAMEALLSRISAKALVGAALGLLKPDECEALVLHYVEELSIREVAQHMRRTEKAVQSVLTRAKTKSRDFLLGLMTEEAAE